MSESERGRSLGATIRSVLGDFGTVGAAYLYGSAARGRLTPLSDADVALVVPADLGSMDRGRLLRQVTTELERSKPGVRFDVRLLDELPAAICGRAVGESLLVFERNPAQRVRAEVRARMLYHDFLPFERRGTREGIAGLRRGLDLG